MPRHLYKSSLLVILALAAASIAGAQKPKITSINKIVSQLQYQTITIKGSGFGTMQPYSGDSDYLAYNNNTQGIQCGFTPDGNACGLIVNSWTDSQIVLGGFTLSGYLPNVKDDVVLSVWNPQSGEGPSGKKVPVITETTTTTLTSSPNPSTDGEAVTFTAAVDSSIGAPPDGETVKFEDGTTLLGTGTSSGGSATFTTSSLPVGKSSITAVYVGDGTTFKTSKSKPVKQVVQ